MSGGITDGQAVSQAVTDPAFIFKNAPDVMPYVLGFTDTTTPSGTSFSNVQGEVNGNAFFQGRTLGSGPSSLPTWTNNDVGASTDNVKLRADNITQKFNGSTGHTHTGSPGDGPKISVGSLSGTQLIGKMIQGVNLTGVTGGTTNVSTQLSISTPSTSQTVQGIVVNAPYNLNYFLDTNGDDILDGSGNKVYGRLTNTGGVGGTWTVTYYSLVSGVETPYSFTGSHTIQWYYQQLFTESTRTVYSDQIVIQSDLVAGEIPTATTSVYGKTLLSSTPPPAIAGAGSAGTANGTVANADHTHAGAGWTIVTGHVSLTDNVSTPTSYHSVSTTGLSGLIVSYGLYRATGQSRHGVFIVSSDSTTTTVQYEDGPSAEQSPTGVALQCTISGGFFNLQYTTTSTGTGATLAFEIKEVPA